MQHACSTSKVTCLQVSLFDAVVTSLIYWRYKPTFTSSATLLRTVVREVHILELHRNNPSTLRRHLPHLAALDIVPSKEDVYLTTAGFLTGYPHNNCEDTFKSTKSILLCGKGSHPADLVGNICSPETSQCGT